jgi:glycosyltransferase involved in cell wall biosynthesis
MVLIRKIKTAKKVFAQYGAKEVFGLLGDNLSSIFLTTGRFITRIFRKAADRIAIHMPRLSSKMRVLYITTEFEAFYSQTVRYRVHNVRQALRGKAHTRFVLVNEGISEDTASLKWADIIVLMRTTWTNEVGKIILEAKKLEIPVVFDIDDIIFLPEYAEYYCRVLGNTGKKNVKGRKREFEGFKRTFDHCRYATASTPFIAEKMADAGKRSFVIHNGLNKKQLKIAKSTHKKTQNVRAIGYLSGTKTHDRDFAQALPALEKILKEYPDVVLRVVGYLDLSVLPSELSEKVQPACYMKWPRLMKYSAQNYINIAPLDIDNPFCNAKSELKYFEAAAVSVPTVASATDTFSRCIKNGENGLIASNSEEWYTSLKRLLDDSDFYKSVARNAHDSALKQYSPDSTAREALEAYKAIIADFKARGNKNNDKRK